MAYDTPYKFLRTDEVAYLADTDHKKDRLIYIDCLALLHDVLTSFSTIPDHSVFKSIWIRHEAKESMQEFRQQAYSIRNNLETNLKSAFDLYDELTSTTRSVTSFVARSYADKYLNDLLEQYREIRYSKVP